MKQISGFLKHTHTHTKPQKTRQSAESLTPSSLREVIIKSWNRHHGAPLEKPEEKQKGLASERRRRTEARKLFQRTENGQTGPDRARQNKSLVLWD